MLELKIDVLEALKEKGYSTYYIRQKTSIGQKTLQDMRRGIVPGIKTIDIICSLLNCQPGDIIAYKPDQE